VEGLKIPIKVGKSEIKTWRPFCWDPFVQATKKEQGRPMGTDLPNPSHHPIKRRERAQTAGGGQKGEKRSEEEPGPRKVRFGVRHLLLNEPKHSGPPEGRGRRGSAAQRERRREGENGRKREGYLIIK
jgi:hypothetical protein